MFYNMTEIKIIPIFAHAAPDVWKTFCHISASALYTNYNYKVGTDELATAITEEPQRWRRNKNRFAFGAYSGNRMIGFIQGNIVGRVATIQSLYVLHEFQKKHVGARLLSSAEHAVTPFASRVELVALIKACPFYESYGYTTQYGTNKYEKRINSPLRYTSAPIFYCTASVARACARIEPTFQAAAVNKTHAPMFVYYDGDGQPVAFSHDSVVHATAAAPRAARLALQKHIDNLMALRADMTK